MASQAGFTARSRHTQRPDRTHRHTQVPRQTANRSAIDPPQSRNRQPRRSPPRHRSPAQRTEARGTLVTLGRKCRGEERQPRTRPGTTMQITDAVGRAGAEPAKRGRRRTVAAAQMQPSPESRSESRIPGHHQDQPARPAKPREVAAQRHAPRIGIMPQHHPRSAARQSRHRGAGIGQATVVGEQP